MEKGSKITQIPIQVVNIRIYFIEGCPGLSAVTENIKEVIAEEAVDAKISLALIETPKDAGRFQFTGSPTVRINGRDIDSNMKAIKDYGLRSRHYFYKWEKIGLFF